MVFKDDVFVKGGIPFIDTGNDGGVELVLDGEHRASVSPFAPGARGDDLRRNAKALRPFKPEISGTPVFGAVRQVTRAVCWPHFLGRCVSSANQFQAMSGGQSPLPGKLPAV